MDTKASSRIKQLEIEKNVGKFYNGLKKVAFLNSNIWHVVNLKYHWNLASRPLFSITKWSSNMFLVSPTTCTCRILNTMWIVLCNLYFVDFFIEKIKFQWENRLQCQKFDRLILIYFHYFWKHFVTNLYGWNDQKIIDFW